ncbi:NUDIX domain-containing protein [Marivita sp. S0852]|uniref:NUDIX domain-containing protein n=1 Tax=Marivita sp. S0852 TaxID=3373893 RepID=UPI003981C50D
MAAFFFYGTLCHAPLLAAVLGLPEADLKPRLAAATLPDHRVSWVKNEAYPMIEHCPGEQAVGVLLSDVSPDEEARLSYYEGAFSYRLEDVKVAAFGTSVKAVCYFPVTSGQTRGAPWVLQDWATVWGDMAEGSARDVMARRARYDADTVGALFPFLMARHWARKMARHTPPANTLRHAPGPDDVTMHARLPGYRGFFDLAEFRLDHKRFDGSRSPEVVREAFLAFDAALVLPYDPVLDQVLLIEQLRYGPLLRDDPNPWVFEPIAGLVDAGEDPADTARREAVEEAGLELGPLELMTRVYASPGYSTEFFHCYLSVCDLSGVTSSVGGLLSEHEDIRSHVLSFDGAMDLIKTGEINAGPLVMMLYWLMAHRAGLRADA